MLSKEMEAALNEQVNAEFYSAYLYLAMAEYLESMNLTGFANWMHLQFHEEQGHALKMANYINERGGRVILKAIEAPQIEWASPLAVFENTLAHEKEVTSLINKLVDQAIKDSDHATNNFLQWFVAEQVEEESTADSIVQQLKLVGEGGHGIFLIDRELGQRQPAAGAEAGA